MEAERTEGAVAFCTECGTPHEMGQRFCANCGAQLGGVITKAQPVTAHVPTRAPISGLSVSSFVFGLLSILGAPLILSPFYGPWLVGALAVFFGVFAHRRAQREGWDRGDALASSGIVLGIIGTLIGALILISVRPWTSPF
jgi:hypothetical protein